MKLKVSDSAPPDIFTGKAKALSQLKSAKKILEELGFNKDSRESTQFAFLKHLKKASQSLEESANIPKEPVQLEFNFDELGPRSGSFNEKTKKVSNS